MVNIQMEQANPCVICIYGDRERWREKGEKGLSVKYLRTQRGEGIALKWRELAVVGDEQKWIDRIEERERRERKGILVSMRKLKRKKN